MTATTLYSPDVLTFEQSQSKALSMHGSLMDKIHDNAPRIVGALKLGGDISFGMTMSPLMIGYAVFSIIGRVVLLAFGTKANQKKVAANAVEHPQAATPKDDSFFSGVKKVAHPKKYPVEASAGLSTVGETFSMAYGISKFTAGGTGFTPLLVGLSSLFAYANILFGKEKLDKPKATATDGDSLVFAQSESKPVGIIGRIKHMLKNNPVLTSSLIQIAIPVGMITGSLAEGLPLTLVVGGSFFLTAAIVQALFVRKNEFNIEGAKNEEAKKPASSFEERIATERKDGPEVQLT